MIALGLLLLSLLAGGGVAAPARLTLEQQNRLKSVLPRTMAKLERREVLRVVSVGDSISAFYQPAGFPRYDSAMSWQGRLLNRLGGYYFYHGVVDVEPHREITSSQKEADVAWAKYAAEMQIWQRTKKGVAPPAPDALRFTADLTQPVGMGVPELVRRGVPGAQQIVPGTVIEIHNLARDGAQTAQAMEALTTEAFPAPPLPQPDLVTFCYGMNDAISSLPLESYRNFLTSAVSLAKKRGAEVIIAAPPVSFSLTDARAALGRSRPYAAIAREVATSTGAAFVDLGAALMENPSDLASLTITDAFDSATASIARDFGYRSGIAETLHPNATATLRMGEAAARQLESGRINGPLELTGSLDISSPEEATAGFRIFNPTNQPRTVVISPLTFTGWQVQPGTPDLLFNLAPGKARRFSLPLAASAVGPAPDRGTVRGSIILNDDDLQQIVDVSLPIQPLAVLWPEGRFDAASGEILLPATLLNQGSSAVKGTATIQWMGNSQEISFSLDPRQKSPLPVRLALPDAAALPRFRENVSILITLPDKKLRFTHRLEGVRQIGIEQRFPLVALDPWTNNQPSPPADTWVTPFADARGIYFIFEMANASSAALPSGMNWGSIEVQLDGRKAGENGGAGFVDRLVAPLPTSDGPTALRKIRPAVFGEGYNFNYHPDGFRVTATTRPDGSRRIEFNIARVNLIQHEWSLDGSGQNTLGINIRLTRNDPVTGQIDPAATRVLSASGFGATDARSLTALELSRTPAARWSVRVW